METLEIQYVSVSVQLEECGQRQVSRTPLTLL